MKFTEQELTKIRILRENINKLIADEKVNFGVAVTAVTGVFNGLMIQMDEDKIIDYINIVLKNLLKMKKEIEKEIK